jgi:hypothetical protein
VISCLGGTSWHQCGLAILGAVRTLWAGKVFSGKSIAHLQGIGKGTVKMIDQYREKGINDK